MLRFLDPIVPADPPPPGPDAVAERTAHPMRAITQQVAFDARGRGWTKERRAKVAALFDGLAPEWHAHRDDPQRTAPLADAYERGAVPAGGTCLEVGSGDGANTAFLDERHETVIALDLSLEMLRRGSGDRVRADAGDAPLRDGAVDVIVLVNALLFPAESDRVLAPGGTVVWVNTAGDLTPIHLTAAEVEEALPGAWDGIASEAGRGTWSVWRRLAP